MSNFDSQISILILKRTMIVSTILAQLSRNKSIFISLIVTGIVWVFFSQFIFQRYEKNDDVAMAAISSGFFNQAPDEHLVFTNVTIGLILKFLCSNFSNTNWYYIYLNLSLFISFFIIHQYILNKNKNKINITSFTFLLISLYALIFNRIQFTSVSLLLGFSGFILLVYKKNNQLFSLNSIAGVLIIIIASLMRDLVLVILVLLFIPLILNELINKKRYIVLLFLLFISISNFLFYQFDQYYYNSDPNWKTFNEYNWIRGKLNGMERMVYNAETKPTFDSVGWSKNDFHFFENWLSVENEIFSLENLKKINKKIEYLSFNTNKNVFLSIKAFIYYHWKWISFLLLLLLISIINQSINKKWIFISVFYYIILSFIFHFSARFPAHISLPFAIISILGTVFHFEKPNWFLHLTLVFFSFTQISIVSNQSRQDERKHDEMINILTETYNKKDGGSLIVQGGSLPLENLSTQSKISQYFPYPVYFLGWTSNLPFYLDNKGANKLSNWPFNSTLGNDKIIIQKSKLLLLIQYIKEHNSIETNQLQVKILFTFYNSNESEESVLVQLQRNYTH